MLKSRLITPALVLVLGSAGLISICIPTRADLIPTAPQKVVTSSSGDSAPTDSNSTNPPQPSIGFDIGEYLPTDSVVQSRFGSQWFTIGIGQGGIPSMAQKGQIRLQLDVLANTKGDNRVILIPLGIAYELGLGTGSTVPYVGFSADLMNSVVQSSTDSVKSEYRAGLAGSVFAGVNFSHDINLEARYREVEKIAGYNFNGLEVSAGLRF